jgi:hypothetical protein
MNLLENYINICNGVSLAGVDWYNVFGNTRRFV